MSTILLHDASILIDLLSVDLLDLAMDLPFEMETTDLIVAEFMDPLQRQEVIRQITNGKLALVQSNSEDLDNLTVLKLRNRRLSLPDCSVVYWAAKHAAIILSGDSLLRKVAVDRRIEVHGILWIFEKLVDNTLLRPTDAAVRLETLLRLNARIPREECEGLIARWTPPAR